MSEFLSKVIAHRGASYEAPENTLASVRLAIKKRAKMIEFDVRDCGDGSLFLFHDATLERCTNHTGSFAALNSEQVSNLEVGSWFAGGEYSGERPPTLTQAIAVCMEANCIPLIEHKGGKPEEYAKVIKNLNAEEKVIVISFDWAFIEQLRELVPQLKIGALGKAKLSTGDKQELIKLKPNWVGWGDKYIEPEAVEWFKEQGITVAIWTVNDRDRANELIKHGVDYIISDRPDYIAAGI